MAVGEQASTKGGVATSSMRSRDRADSAAVTLAGGIASRDRAPIDSEAAPRFVPQLKRMLANDTRINTAHLRVRQSGELIMCYGAVESHEARVYAQAMIREWAGDIPISDQLAIVPTQGIVDRMIARNIISMLEAHPAIDTRDIVVNVARRRVTLTGEADSWVMECGMYTVAVNAFGVKTAHSHVTVRSEQ